MFKVDDIVKFYDGENWQYGTILGKGAECIVDSYIVELDRPSSLKQPYNCIENQRAIIINERLLTKV